MKHFVLPVISAFMLISGIVCLLDLILVLSGCVVPVSYPEFGMSWNDSPIIHYNVSVAANILIGMMAAMALFVGSFLVVVNRTPKSKVNHLPRLESKRTEKWLKDQLN